MSTHIPYIETEALITVMEDDRDSLDLVLKKLSGAELKRLRSNSDRLALYVQRFIETGTVFLHGHL